MSELFTVFLWCSYAPIGALEHGGWWHVLPALLAFFAAIIYSWSLNNPWCWILLLSAIVLWPIYGLLCVYLYGLYL